MPTVKISELPEIYHLSTNTEATLVVGVDLDTGTTGKINVATLGEGLYAYQPLKVGENQVLFANTIGQFSGNSNTYLQINNQNFNFRQPQFKIICKYNFLTRFNIKF